MIAENIYIEAIKEKLQTINPYLILLFGSYAYGKPHTDSDIDLLVVTNDSYVPKNFKEKQALHLSVLNPILHIAKQIPIDLIVYTLPMYQEFITLQSSFAKEILTYGITLYETNNPTMA